MPRSPLAAGIVRALGLAVALAVMPAATAVDLPAPEPAGLAEIPPPTVAAVPADAEPLAAPEPLFAPAEFQELVQAEVRRQLATAGERPTRRPPTRRPRRG